MVPQIFSLFFEVSKQAVEGLCGQKLHSAGIPTKQPEHSLDCTRRRESLGQLTSATLWQEIN